MRWLIDKVHVSIPFTMLYESHMALFIHHRLNPEIGLDAMALDRFSMVEFTEIAEKLHSKGLKINFHGPFVDLSPGSSDPAIRELTRHRFEQVIRLVPLFRPLKVVCHASYDRKRYGYFRDTWLENSIEIWAWMGEALKRSGSRLVLENVYEHHPDDIRVLFERLEKNGVGFCLDTGHQAAFSRSSLETWVNTLAGAIDHLHLHDNDGSNDDHWALGKGSIDFSAFFNHLKKMRNEPPTMTLEPHRKADLWPSIEYLSKVWPW